jgi:hypothetical protein
MADLSDLYAKLKSSIVGTKTQKIDLKLDKAVRDIVSYKSQSGRKGYIDLVKAVISKSTNGMNIGLASSSNNLFGQGSAGPAAFGQGHRLMRYTMYQAIVANINYCYRALTVLVENILSPDDITKVSLEIKPKSFLEDENPNEAKAKIVKQVVKLIELEEKLDTIVYNTLLFGDFFCEIGDAKKALTSRSILTESQAYVDSLNRDMAEGLIEKFSTPSKELKKDINVEIDYRALKEAEKDPELKELTDDDDELDKERKTILRNMKLIFHEAKNVIVLQSALFPVCFGYLIFPNIEAMGVSGISIADETVNQICLSILRSLEKKIPQMKEFRDDKELKNIIKSMIVHSDPQKALDIRYVPPDMMVHFKRPTTKYYPYGESIFDSTQYAAKVLIALETALAIQRLSRSTEKRKIAVEIGLPRDARQAIESMKEEFRKRKVSLDNFGTVDTIPSMITTFEDIYIPQKDGKPFVDVSTFNEGNVDIRSKVDELKFMRDSLVSSLGVPPAFIGIEENLSNKAALSEENILFARTIISHQKYLTHQINDLIQQIFNIIDPEGALTILDNVMIALPVPKSLQFEREARYMNEIAGLIESLERLGVPKEYSKKKYLSNFDWDDVKKYEIDEKVEKAVDPTKNEDEMGGMGGIGGGGLGGGF